MDASERRARVADEAAQWWARLGTSAPVDVSAADREEFTRWLRESPLHLAELLHVAHVQDALEHFKLWDEIPLETQAASNNVVTLSGSHDRRGASAADKRTWKKVRGAPFFVAAGTCLIAVAAGWLTLHSGARTLQTDRAERREVVLDDGSIVSLDPETQLRVELGRTRRDITLTRGRALFYAAKDPTRPFIVRAGDTRVRAVGTTFGVEEEGQNTIVTVSEGKVSVIPTSQLETAVGRSNSDETGDAAVHSVEQSKGPRAPAGSFPAGSSASDVVAHPGSASPYPGEVFLSANQQITVLNSGDATPVREVDSTRALAWSQGRLVFDSTPLGEVARQFNRYNRMQLHISGPELARRTVSGVFRASDPETLIDFISAGAHVVVVRKSDKEIVISPAP